MKKLIKILLSSVLLTTSSFAYADLNVLNLSYRTGPFATTGIPLMDGMLDYANMLNERDGGIGGQKYNMIECETGYSTDKGVECYSKLKGDNIIELPHVWRDLVDLESIGVTLTPIGCYQELFVEKIQWGTQITAFIFRTNKLFLCSLWNEERHTKKYS